MNCSVGVEARRRVNSRGLTEVVCGKGRNDIVSTISARRPFSMGAANSQFGLKEIRRQHSPNVDFGLCTEFTKVDPCA